MRQAGKGRKKFQTRIPFVHDPGKKIPKKNSKKIQKTKKTCFRQYFQPKRDQIGQEREKKILGPNSADTGPRQENSEKNSKKIQKIKKSLFGNIPSQNGMRQAEKGRKKFQARIPLILDPGKKISKKLKKKTKKPLSGIIPKQNWMRKAEKGIKKFQSRISIIVDPGSKISKKIAKKFKKSKNHFSALFLAETG